MSSVRLLKPYPRLIGTQFVRDLKRKPAHILFIAQAGLGAYTVTCFCPKSRKRKDGGCPHADLILAAMKPWHRKRCRIEPYQERGSTCST